MSKSSFFNTSKLIADQFIQSVLFVDDQIFSDPSNEEDIYTRHNLDAPELIKAFSKAQKLCALNNPHDENQLEEVISLAKQTDILILDWRMLLTKKDISSEDEEEDVDSDELRGEFTLKVIKSLFADDKFTDSLKLILIYTGEVDLQKIVETLATELKQYNVRHFEKNYLGTLNSRIIVAGKPSLSKQLKHNAELKKWIIPYANVPDILLTEFTKMTEGIVSNVALKAITSIRQSTFKLLGVYNKKVDSGFLSHRSLLPQVDDASELLKDSLLNSLRAILDYNKIENYCNYKYISKWIDDRNLNEKSIKILKKDMKLNKPELKKWQKDGFIEAFKIIWKKQLPKIDLVEDKLSGFFRSEVHKQQEIFQYFLPDDVNDDLIEENFSILTHHKSNHANPSYVPKLTLGTVIKGVKSKDYWLCIQQKCDSIRIQNGEERRFLFLPLLSVNKGKKFNFVVFDKDDIIRLLVISETHKIKTIKFKATSDEVVYARKFGKLNKYLFRPLYSQGHKDFNKDHDENYYWVMDLKDDQAQRIANSFAAKLSRVGLDESEWLRRWST